MSNIKLGDRVKDKISPFTGIVIARTEYLFGCVWVEVASEVLGSDGLPIKGVWMDESRFDKIGKDGKVVAERIGAGGGIVPVQQVRSVPILDDHEEWR